MRLITNFMLPCLNLLLQHTAPPEGGSTGSCLHFTDWDCHVGTRNAETSVSRPRTLSCGYDKFLNTLVRAVLQSDSGFTPFRYQFTADRELQESQHVKKGTVFIFWETADHVTIKGPVKANTTFAFSFITEKWQKKISLIYYFLHNTRILFNNLQSSHLCLCIIGRCVH